MKPAAEGLGGPVLMRWGLATLGIAGFGTIVFTAMLLLARTDAGLAIGAAIAVWMGVALLIWLGAPRYLGPTVVALPLILVAALFIILSASIRLAP